MTKEESQPQRIFTISAKSRPTSEMNWNDRGVKVTIARDMIANARELAPDLDNWPDVLSHLRGSMGRVDREYDGELGLAYSMGVLVGMFAVRLGWSMHQPEMVYLSGYHVVWSLETDIYKLANQIERMRRNTFVDADGKPSESKKSEAIAKAQAEVFTLTSYHRKMNEAVQGYASQYLPQGEQGKEYLELLTGLMYAPVTQVRQKPKILTLLSGGKTSEAIDLWKKHRPAKVRREFV